MILPIDKRKICAIYRGMKQIKIFPIFNQDTKGVWDKFIKIHSAALAGNGINFSEKNIADCKYVLEDNWQTKLGNFAFAAYFGRSMVGQINGYLIEDGVFVENLYVLPKYQNIGVGGKLLKAAEKSASVSKKCLFSSFEAGEFYEKQKYFLTNEACFYERNIQNEGSCDTVPLFYCPANIAKACNKISGKEYKLQSKTVNELHKPVFVYRDINNVISGYGVIDVTKGQVQQNIFGKTDWVKWCLKNTMDKYLLRQQMLFPHSR